jgi:hypothetical protein
VRANGLRARMWRTFSASAAVAALTGGAIALSSTPAVAAGALTSVSMSVSNNAASLGGVTNTATYSWNFVTATAGTLTSLSFTVPSGTTGASLTVGTTYGLGACTVGAATLASTTVTVALTTCGSIAASTPVYVPISGFTNSTTTTGSFASVASTYTGSSVLNDSGTATAVNFASNQTAVTVVVPNSLTFTNSATAVSLLAVPGTVATASPVVLGVSTNARNGYTLSGCVTSSNVLTGGTSGATIPSASNTAVAALPTSGTTSAFGAQAAITGTGATLQTLWAGTTGSNYLGYAATCGTTGGQKISSNTGPTSGDTLTLTNGVGVSATQTADTYSGKITYQVVPSY